MLVGKEKKRSDGRGDRGNERKKKFCRHASMNVSRGGIEEGGGRRGSEW